MTDLELQRQLLQYRFGFQAADVLTLKNQEATRAAILEAIDQHFIQQAQGDDLVVLHFSGFGSQVNIDSTPGTGTVAWVTVDSRLPTEENPIIADLLEVEIADRLKQLPTSKYRHRSGCWQSGCGIVAMGQSEAEVAPHKLLPASSGPDLPPKILTQLESSTPWPGLLLRAGETGHLVLESQWQGLSVPVSLPMLSPRFSGKPCRIPIQKTSHSQN